MKTHLSTKRMCFTLVVALYLYVVITRLIGIDFGFHWDETRTQIQRLEWTLESELLLPRWYKYPMLTYDLGLLNVAWDAAAHLLSREPHPQGWKVHLIRAIYELSFLKRLRVELVILSYLAIAWIFIGVYRWRRNAVESLLAAAIFGFSWEIGYHARWYAGDPLTVMFVALSLMCVLSVPSARSPRLWWRLGAIAAGLATSAKYPGGAALLPVLLSILVQPARPMRERMLHGAEAMIFFVVAFIVTTPGAVIDPFVFVQGLLAEQEVYSAGHGGHTISPGGEHMLRMTVYLGLAAFSHQPIVAGVFTLMAVIGTLAVLRHDWRVATVILACPLLLFVFYSTYNVMLVRNVLPIVPAGAVLAAHGAIRIQERFSGRRPLNLIFAGVVIILLATNASWLLREARSVRDRGVTDFTAQLANYIDRRPNEQFLVSDRVRTALAVDGAQRPNLTPSRSDADSAVFYLTEVTPWQRWPCNHLRFFDACFGPYEVNLNYYPNWAGDDRVVVMPIANSVGLDVFEE